MATPASSGPSDVPTPRLSENRPVTAPWAPRGIIAISSA
jgi:hypothetical protein